MKHKLIQRACLGFAVALLVAGCASTPVHHSGFLSDYSKLKEQEAIAGGKAMVFLSPDFTPQRYNALIIEPVQFYPEPQPSAGVSMETLNQIQNYTTQTLRQKFGQKVRLVDSPGPGVVRWRIAFTAVGDEKRELKPYQYVPVALIVTGAKAAAQGGLPHDATIALENEAVDSVTKQPLYMAVRGGTGERVKEDAEGKFQVSLESLKPLIDNWTDHAAKDINKFIRAK